MSDQPIATLSVEISGTVEEFDTTHAAASIAMQGVLATLREWKPNDRSEIDRRYAVTITMMEQAWAYFHTWVINEQNVS